MILLKDEKVFEGLLKGKYPNILIEMALEVVKLISSFDSQVVITSSFREGDAGVHGVFRGLDFRSYALTKDQITIIVDCMNSNYCYDDSRPNMKVLLFHNVGLGPHLHLQSHPHTRRTK
jgi:hypothetical protein